MNTRRRMLIATAAGAILPSAAIAQQPANALRKIAFLGVGSASGYVNEIQTIRDELRKLGYVEGRNITIEFRWDDGDQDKLRQFALELVALKPDVIITHATSGVRNAVEATHTIPIVLADAPDPVALGVADSLTHPGRNVTGSTGFQAELSTKRLELLKELLPRFKRIGILVNSAGTSQQMLIDPVEQAAKAMKCQTERFNVTSIDALPDAIASIAKRRPDGVVITENPLLNSNVRVMAALMATHKLPAIGISSFAEAGGLIGYSANRPLLYGRSAYFVDRIFKGAKPGDLPIERAIKFDLIVNTKAAHALHIKIPQTLLQRADKVIE